MSEYDRGFQTGMTIGDTNGYLIGEEDGWARGHAKGIQHGYGLALGAIECALQEKIEATTDGLIRTGLKQALTIVQRSAYRA
jgi:hypothetical protein